MRWRCILRRIKIEHKELRAMRRKNDRYIVYSMLGKNIAFRWRLRKIKGEVTSVLRDIFEDCIRITIGSRTYQFDEPAIMYADDKQVVFIYGDVESLDFTDDELFDEFRESGFSGETMEDVIKRTGKDDLREMRFDIVE